MRAIRLHDKRVIEAILREDTHLHLYGLGDLDDFFWPRTAWYSTPDAVAGPAPVVLVYHGSAPPSVLALHRDGPVMGELLAAILPVLPRPFQLHATSGVEQAFESARGAFRVHSRGEHLKMALTDPDRVLEYDCDGTVPLTGADREELLAFYRDSYPGNWFDPRMLGTGQYYGIRHGDTLVSVAGIHVYSPEYGVAALGNVATAPAHRGRGYARRVTARVCQSLLLPRAGGGAISHIGLNVKADNTPAIAGYRGLGFQVTASYSEYFVEDG